MRELLIKRLVRVSLGVKLATIVMMAKLSRVAIILIQMGDFVTRKEAILEELKSDDEKLILMLAALEYNKAEINKLKKDDEYKNIIEEKIKKINESLEDEENVSS
jgi:hypothetical protein